MKILYIIDPVTQGGATESFIEVISQMTKRGVKCYVCTSKSSSFDDRIRKAGGVPLSCGHMTVLEPISPYKWKRPIKYPIQWLRFRIARYKALKKISSLIDISSINLIHTNSARNDIGCYLNKQYNIPHLMHIREFADKDFKCIPLDRKYIDVYNKYTSMFVAVSDAVKKHWVSKGLEKQKIDVVYNGIKEDIAPSPNQDKLNAKLQAIMTSGICEAKGQMQVLEALSLLPIPVLNCIHVDFVGWADPQYLSSLEEYVQAHELKKNVSFLGKCSSVHSILHNYQLGLTCSKCEGFGRVTAEYMHARLGVIASDTGANPELIKNGNTGLLYKEGDVKNLAVKIQELLENRDELVSLSNNAQNFAKSNFTDIINADNIYRIYKRLCARK